MFQNFYTTHEPFAGSGNITVIGVFTTVGESTRQSLVSSVIDVIDQVRVSFSCPHHSFSSYAAIILSGLDGYHLSDFWVLSYSHSQARSVPLYPNSLESKAFS